MAKEKEDKKEDVEVVESNEETEKKGSKGNKEEVKEEEVKERKEAKKGSEEEVKKKRELTDDEKIIELTNLVKSVQADFENYKKRTEKDMQECVKQSSKFIINNLLPVVDHFELALTNKDNTDEFTKGMEMIYKQLIQVLESEGLKKIKCEGEKFDPYQHEALMQENNDDEEDGIILEELQKGYMINEEVIRPSKVKVNKKSEVKKNESASKHDTK